MANDQEKAKGLINWDAITNPAKAGEVPKPIVDAKIRDKLAAYNASLSTENMFPNLQADVEKLGLSYEELLAAKAAPATAKGTAHAPTGTEKMLNKELTLAGEEFVKVMSGAATNKVVNSSNGTIMSDLPDGGRLLELREFPLEPRVNMNDVSLPNISAPDRTGVTNQVAMVNGNSLPAGGEFFVSGHGGNVKNFIFPNSANLPAGTQPLEKILIGNGVANGNGSAVVVADGMPYRYIPASENNGKPSVVFRLGSDAPGTGDSNVLIGNNALLVGGKNRNVFSLGGGTNSMYLQSANMNVVGTLEPVNPNVPNPVGDSTIVVLPGNSIEIGTPAIANALGVPQEAKGKQSYWMDTNVNMKVVDKNDDSVAGFAQITEGTPLQPGLSTFAFSENTKNQAVFEMIARVGKTGRILINAAPSVRRTRNNEQADIMFTWIEDGKIRQTSTIENVNTLVINDVRPDSEGDQVYTIQAGELLMNGNTVINQNIRPDHGSDIAKLSGGAFANAKVIDLDQVALQQGAKAVKPQLSGAVAATLPDGPSPTPQALGNAAKKSL